MSNSRKKTGSYTESSPRAKYSKQHGEPRRNVNLSSENIPGVSVSGEQIEKLTQSQLKFWLKKSPYKSKGQNKGTFGKRFLSL